VNSLAGRTDVGAFRRRQHRDIIRAVGGRTDRCDGKRWVLRERREGRIGAGRERLRAKGGTWVRAGSQ